MSITRSTVNDAITEVYSTQELLHSSCYTKKYTKLRHKKMILLNSLLNKYTIFAKLPRLLRTSIVKNLERSCYNSACTLADDNNIIKNWENTLFVDSYTVILYKICVNINKKYIKLIEMLITNRGILTQQELTEEYMNPTYNIEFHKVIDERKRQFIKKKYSYQYKCSKCKQSKTTVQDVQLKAVDEGSTLLVECATNGCGHHWKIGSK